MGPRHLIPGALPPAPRWCAICHGGTPELRMRKAKGRPSNDTPDGTPDTPVSAKLVSPQGFEPWTP